MFFIWKLFKFIFKLIIGAFLLSVLVLISYKWFPVPVTPLMMIRCTEQLSKGKEIKLKHKWAALSNISINLQKAVICSEDQAFLTHNGFDFEAMKKAFENNKKGKKIKGGSTISQQTAKNVFLWPSRSYIRKGLEMIYTFLIEFFWSKERILEIYLNSIEMGKGIYGAEAASQYWFNKPAAKLTSSESAAIAAILPGPTIYKAQPANNYILNRKQFILVQMDNFGPTIPFTKPKK